MHAEACQRHPVGIALTVADGVRVEMLHRADGCATEIDVGVSDGIGDITSQYHGIRSRRWRF